LLENMLMTQKRIKMFQHQKMSFENILQKRYHLEGRQSLSV